MKIKILIITLISHNSYRQNNTFSLNLAFNFSFLFYSEQFVADSKLGFVR